MVYFMMRHWESIGRSTGAKGQVTIGGYVTYLAKKIGVTRFRYKESGKVLNLDMDYVKAMKYVSVDGMRYMWKWGDYPFPLLINQPLDLKHTKTFRLVVRPGELDEAIVQNIRNVIGQFREVGEGLGVARSDAPVEEEFDQSARTEQPPLGPSGEAQMPAYGWGELRA